MTRIESLMTAALVALTTLAAFALTVAVLTFGSTGLVIFASGVIADCLLPRPRP